MKAVGFGEHLVQLTRYPRIFPVSVYLVREDDSLTLIDTALATWHLPTALESALTLLALEPSRLAVGHGPVLEDPLPAIDRAIEVAGRKVGNRSLRAARCVA